MAFYHGAARSETGAPGVVPVSGMRSALYAPGDASFRIEFYGGIEPSMSTVNRKYNGLEYLTNSYFVLCAYGAEVFRRRIIAPTSYLIISEEAAAMMIALAVDSGAGLGANPNFETKIFAPENSRVYWLPGGLQYSLDR